MEIDPYLRNRGISKSKRHIEKSESVGFITFEGIDACGKSVQAETLVNNLHRQNIPVCFVRDPGGPAVSERIRDVLLDRDLHTMSALTELFLYEAARSQLMTECIRPALDRGEVVVSDRFTDSTLAYQGYGRSLPLSIIRDLNHHACGGMVPTRTYILDISWEESVRRRSLSPADNDRLESEAEQFYRRIRKGYRILAKEEPSRIRLLDGTLSIEILEQQILEDALSLIIP